MLLDEAVNSELPGSMVSIDVKTVPMTTSMGRVRDASSQMVKLSVMGGKTEYDANASKYTLASSSPVIGIEVAAVVDERRGMYIFDANDPCPVSKRTREQMHLMLLRESCKIIKRVQIAYCVPGVSRGSNQSNRMTKSIKVG